MRTRSSNKKTTPTLLGQGLEEQKRLVSSDLKESISLEDDNFPCSLYHHLASESAVNNFLKKSRFYSLAQRRWKLPRNCAKLLDNDFYTPFSNILTSILQHFWKDSYAQGTRKIVDTHATRLAHRGTESVNHSSNPSFVIKAMGPSFSLPCSDLGGDLREIGFSNVSSCIDIQIEDKQMSVAEQLTRVAIYAR